MKLKRHSKTLWFNWFITTLVTTAGVVVIYLPEIGLDQELVNKIMMGLVLLTTFGNKYLRGLTNTEIS